MTSLRLATLRDLNLSDETLIAELTGSLTDAFEPLEGEISLAKISIPRTLDFTDDAKIVASDLKVAKVVFSALKPIFASRPALERDPGFWTWLSVKPFRDYTLRRWCGGFLVDEGAPPFSSGMLTHFRFGSTSNLKSFTRNSIARLYIVFRAIDDVGGVTAGEVDSLASTLLVARTHQEVFERLIGLDAELVVLIARHLARKKLGGVTPRKATADLQRRFLKNLNLALGSVAIETLSLSEKQSLVGGL